ncbi:alpha/beta hydrolase [Mycobacterium branderi]|uniref:Alpha/beta hydrolase n=1 Tax=Mycobacterium branderi TaxID=43348 RepID=A0A7I7WBD4_9MYCO|nr:alpha/beta hydrolase [Mycobacterium branderi]MCV7231570.1 alpha/beta hydrolase [Mycobacterium branderi]ORA40432.1 alpha/beta hydrolase [Mycobacterium branderi]BBZ14946.1 esterase [Mycobacterium branderi]
MATRLVFVHGGLHTGGCWADTIDVIAALRPDIETLVVDLPGRRSVPGDLAYLTIDDCVCGVTQQITGHIPGDGPLVLVGHSLAGVILSGVVNRLGIDRVPHVIFVACCVPADGECVLDTLPFGLKRVVRHLVNRAPVIDRIPPGLVRYCFSNCATSGHRAKIKQGIVPESSALLTQAQVGGFPGSMRTSWIVTRRDRALPEAKQRAFIQNLGGVDDLVCIDAGHEVMITHPWELASALIALTG